MIRATAFISLFFIAITSIVAQEIRLKGQVSIHNSGYKTGKIKYVQNAYVSAAFAGSDDTDVDGKFSLTFSGIDKGTSVEVSVEKSGLEIVNKKDLQDIVIGRLTPLKVFAAPKGQLARAQTELYEISLAAITAKHEALIVKLRKGGEESKAVIQQLEQQLNREIVHRFEAEELLFDQLETTKKRLPETVKKLAQVNLDIASEDYRRAYQAYRAGKVERAILILDQAQLAKQVSQALLNIEQIKSEKNNYQLALEQVEEQVDQIIQAYTLKAEANHLIFDYRSAVQVYTKVVDLMEQIKPEVDLELANAYQSMGSLNRDLGDYVNSIEYYKKCVAAKEKIYVSVDEQNLLVAYNDLANAYSLFGDHQKSSGIQGKVLRLLNNESSIDSLMLSAAQVGLGVSYRYQGKYNESINLFNQAIGYLEKVQDETLSDKHNLAAAYSNLALTYGEANENEKALNLQKKALKVILQIYPSDHPEISSLYNNLALAFTEFTQCDSAVYYTSKAIAQLEANGIEEHPSLGIMYDNKATAHLCLDQLELAQEAQDKAIVFLQGYYGDQSIHTATSKSILADIYNRKKEYELEYLTYKQVYDIRKKILGDTNPQSIMALKSLIRSSDLTAALYKQRGKLKEAIDFEEESIDKLYHLFTLEQASQTDSIQMANKFYFLANLYEEVDQLDSALQIALTCANWREQLLDPLHENIALTHFFISMIYINNPESSIGQSLPHLERSYNIWSQTRKPDDYSFTVAKNSIFLAYSVKGIEAEKNKEYQKAAQYFIEALRYVYSEADNKEFKTRMLQGYSKEDLPLKIAICSYYAKDYTLALTYLKDAYDLGTLDEVSYLYLSGICYAKTEKLEETKRCFERIQLLLPEDGLVFRNWALYFAFLNNEKAILDNLEKAFEHDYKDWQWIEDELNFDQVRQFDRYKKLIQKMKSK